VLSVAPGDIQLAFTAGPSDTTLLTLPSYTDRNRLRKLSPWNVSECPIVPAAECYGLPWREPRRNKIDL
jgi:hypothetical protein